MHTLDQAPGLRRPLPLTPLIDVVFLLLLFFMLASVFHKEGEIEISAAGSRPVTTSSTQPVFVRLHGNGGVDVNGQPVKPEDLGLAVAMLTRSNDHLSGAIIQVRGEAKALHVIRGLVNLKRAGISPVALVK